MTRAILVIFSSWPGAAVVDKKRLKKLLSYKNPEIIARFSKSLGLSKSASELVFKDLMCFLWLTERARYLYETGVHKVQQDVSILEPMLIIDEMWHIFVLYTEDYHEFSFKYFGHYIHHAPARILRPKEKSKKARMAGRSLVGADQVESLIEFVWDELGEKMAHRWFKQLPNKFSKVEIRTRQLKHADAA